MRIDISNFTSLQVSGNDETNVTTEADIDFSLADTANNAVVKNVMFENNIF